jgi:hypothetical protein
VGHAGADRRAQAPVPLHAIAGDPRAQLDPAAGHAVGAQHLRGAHPHAQGAGRGDERGQPARGRA